MGLDVSVLIPYRYLNPHQDQVKNWVVSGWRSHGIDVVVGEDDEGAPFNLSRAANRAFRRSTADVIVVYGADHVPDPERVRELGAELADAPWTGVYAATSGVTMEATLGLLAGKPVDVSKSITATVPFCTGIIACRRDAYAEVPMDERFFGWGCEDVAHRCALETVFGQPPPPRGTLYALWHAAAPRDRFNANAAILGEYIAASTSPDAMREVLKRGAP